MDDREDALRRRARAWAKWCIALTVLVVLGLVLAFLIQVARIHDFRL